ncbi:hypothetical protein [Bifidobacterium magnum]|uniref:Uncharacterized protein n=1 Tax=Bifidobacterium magnum TaxID=1692 RepID=A0A087B665_9BIFI|nr:hypothetical protein [Bifidobacterium magnum]KFI66515.1 hypothetical protein BMAGN_1423 [Bifidobacterium magnum]
MGKILIDNHGIHDSNGFSIRLTPNGPVVSDGATVTLANADGSTTIDMRDGSSSFAMVEHDKNTLYLIKDKQTKKVYAGDYAFA